MENLEWRMDNGERRREEFRTLGKRVADTDDENANRTKKDELKVERGSCL